MIAIFSKVKMNAKLIIGAVIFVIFATIGQMLAPAMVSVMLTDGVNNKNYGLITGMAIAIISLTILACIMNLISTKLASKITTRFCADLRKKFFHKVQTFSSAEIDKFGTASLITRNTTDVTTIQNFFIAVF